MLILLSLLWVYSAHAIPPIQDILDPGALDRTADPCENFYQYSCGTWNKTFQLPPDKNSYWRQGDALNDHVEEQLNDILAAIAGGKAKSSSPYSAKLASFYNSCMNVSEAEKTGLPNLLARMKKLDNLPDRASIANNLAELHLLGVSALFSFYNDQDMKDSKRVIAFVDRGGMGLPDRDYYLKDDPKSQEIRDRYKDHIQSVLKMVGYEEDRAKTAADFILEFETDMARHALAKDDLRDQQKRFHPMTIAELKKLATNVDWDTYIKAIGIANPKKLNVVEPELLKTVSARLADMGAGDLSDYLKFHLIKRSAYYVGGALQAEDFKFWKSYLLGQKELPPRWKYCTRAIAADMGEALGQAYVASIPNAALIRSKTLAMLAEIKQAFKENLGTLTWMDETTRKSASKKLQKLGKKVGWPDRWRDYSKLKMGDHTFFENELQATEFESHRTLNKIGKPMDRTEWDILAWEANAYYHDANNEMVLPLGELVPPNFDLRFSDGANYGSLGGGTIGHELTHGFDDSGKDMDADGNLVTWWTPKSKELFESKSACFIKQTEGYEIIPGSSLHIRGKATLGENLADNGGVKLGLIGLKKAMLGRKVAAPFEGLNEIQQYFLAYGQSWCMKKTDERLRDDLMTDFHPPAEFRVNAVVANQPGFAEAFSCKPGARLAPKDRCAIW